MRIDSSYVASSRMRIVAPGRAIARAPAMLETAPFPDRDTVIAPWLGSGRAWLAAGLTATFRGAASGPPDLRIRMTASARVAAGTARAQFRRRRPAAGSIASRWGVNSGSVED